MEGAQRLKQRCRRHTHRYHHGTCLRGLPQSGLSWVNAGGKKKEKESCCTICGKRVYWYAFKGREGLSRLIPPWFRTWIVPLLSVFVVVSFRCFAAEKAVKRENRELEGVPVTLVGLSPLLSLCSTLFLLFFLI